MTDEHQPFISKNHIHYIVNTATLAHLCSVYPLMVSDELADLDRHP